MSARVRVVLSLALALGAGTVSGVAGAEPMVSTSKIAPTQTEYGALAVDNKFNKWVVEAKAQGISLPKYTDTVLRGVFATAKIPVVIAPDGVVRTLDGHHKLSALVRVQKITGVSVPVNVDVIKDYSGYSETRYANHFVNKLGKGYFGDSPSESAVEKLRSLPRSLSGMRDNPMRSVIGLVFDRAGLEGSWFKDYVQFDLAALLKTSGRLPKAPNGAASNPKYLDAVAKVIFGEPRFTKYLQQQLKPQHIKSANLVFGREVRKASARPKVLSRLGKLPSNSRVRLRRSRAASPAKLRNKVQGKTKTAKTSPRARR